MKNPMVISVLLVVFSACVPLRDYRSAKEGLAAITADNKALRKELRTLQKEQKQLMDTVAARLARNTAEARAMEKRLDQYKVKIRMNEAALRDLDIRKPDSDPALYRDLWKRYSSRDTHAASRITWLTKSEKEIYYYLNYARLNPKEFCKRFVMPRLRWDSNNVYLLTLIDYMYTMGPRNAVVPDKAQYDAALCHAVSSGLKGYIGHERQDASCKKIFSGECCSYGVSDPLGVVLQLLVDNGVPSLGHRYICLGWYEKCGIATATHKGFGVNTVLDFD